MPAATTAQPPTASTGFTGQGAGSPPPATSALPSSQLAQTSAQSPTIGAAYAGIPQSDQDVINAANSYKGVATTPVDEQGIRTNVLNSLEAEIDATNSVYAQKLADAEKQGANLVGGTTATDARRGVTGSDFGTADQYGTASKNSATYAGIDAERQAAISAIIDKGNTEANAEIANKQTAQKNGADSYINFLNAAQTRQQTRTTNAAQAALASGVDLTSAPKATVQAIADSYQIDPSALVAEYVSSKTAFETAQAGLNTALPYGSSLIDKATGKTITPSIFGTGGAGNSTGINPATGLDPTTATSADILGYLSENGITFTRYNAAGYINAIQNGATAQDIISGKVSVAAQTAAGTSGADYKVDPLTGQFVQPNPSKASPVSSSTKLPAEAPPSSGSTSLPAAPASPTPVSTSLPTSKVQPTSGSPDLLQPLPQPTSYTQKTYLTDFTSGTTATQINSLNTAIGHLFDANGAFSALQNGSLQYGNSVSNFAKTQTGSAAVTNYEQAQDLVSSEIANAYGANAVSDRQTQGAFGSSYQSPQQHAGYVQTVSTFLSSKIAANVQSYRTAMGANPSSLDIFISPANQVKLSAMGVNVSNIVPGLSPSPYTQQLLSGAQFNKTTGQIRIPNGNGGYQILQ